jgi:hypothetical protein
MRRIRRRRRAKNVWKKHPRLHRKAALKGWRRHKKHGRKARKSTGKRYIRYKGHKVSWMGLVKKLGVLGAKRKWRKSHKIGGKR